MQALARLLVVCGASVAWALLTTTDATAQKPVVRHDVEVDSFRSVPPTLEELWRQSAVVIEGVVEAAEPVTEGWRGSPPPDDTRFTITPTLVFKGDVDVYGNGPRITLTMFGVMRDAGDHYDLIEDPDLPLFTVHQRLILFLVRDKVVGSVGFRTTTLGPDSAYLVTGDTLVTRSLRPVAQEVSSQGHQGLVARLRAMAGVK